VFENKSSPEREKVDGRCLSCWSLADNHIDNLKNVMNEANHKVLLEQLELIENHDIEIDVKVLEDARILLEKLKTQVNLKSILIKKIYNKEIINDFFLKYLYFKGRHRCLHPQSKGCRQLQDYIKVGECHQ
jgi:hypothetical protein